MSKKRQWGIIGTGNIARKLAAALAESDTGELRAVGSRKQETADAFAREFSLENAYASYDELIADEAVEVIYNSLPNHLHLEWTVKCAEAGKHVLCEKPLTVNATEAGKLIDVIKARDVFMMEAFMYRCHPQTAKLVELIRDKIIGDVRLIQATFAYNMGEALDNIRFQNEAAGGAVMDVGCYCVSMTRLIAGAALGLEGPAEPLAIKGVGHIGQASRVDEWATASLEFGQGILATTTCASNLDLENTLRIWGSQGHIEVPNPWFPGTKPDQSQIIVQTKGKETECISVPGTAGLYTLEVDIVAAHIDQRQAPHPCMNWQDSLGNMAALDAWRASIGLTFDMEKDQI